MKLSVSLLNSKDRMLDVVKLNNMNINSFHIDVMDGKFVSQKNFSIDEIKKLSNTCMWPLDIHLMTEDPLIYIENLKDLSNIDNITFHLEIDKDINSILLQMKKYGVKRGISIKPNTDISLLKPYLKNIDLILIMSVEPGLGGQSFIESTTERIGKIKELIKDYDILLEVDGGINDMTIKKVSLVDIAVVGSYIINSDNMKESIDKLLV